MKIINFGKFTMKIRNVCEIYLTNMENFPFYRNISMEIGTLMYIWRDGGNTVKIVQIFNGHSGQGVTAVACYMP
jgi:hypothetical protein